ncbi:MAG TPA: hypothetical protein VGY54_09605 [Polyangiaceae bacterium]|nr:hypothetical protein [Polyangiaceae bacterium]
MFEDDLLERIRSRVPPSAPAPAETTAIEEVERLVGFSLPRFYVRLLTEVANGGFGPGHSIIGVPPDGFVDGDLGCTLTAAYLKGRDCNDPKYRQPKGLLHLCN